MKLAKVGLIGREDLMWRRKEGVTKDASEMPNVNIYLRGPDTLDNERNVEGLAGLHGRCVPSLCFPFSLSAINIFGAVKNST